MKRWRACARGLPACLPSFLLQRLGVAKARIESDVGLPSEVDFAALSAWLLSVRARLYEDEQHPAWLE